MEQGTSMAPTLQGHRHGSACLNAYIGVPLAPFWLLESTKQHDSFI